MYLFKWKRLFLWHSKKVSGHQYVPDQNKMVLYLPDGGVLEIPKWSSCAICLGVDWVASVKSEMEKKSGASVPLNVGG